MRNGGESEVYKIKENVDLETLGQFGFKRGYEYPDNERCICNDFQRDDFWLIPFDPDEPDKIYYADEDFDQPIWCIYVNSIRTVWIDCVPSGTYHIDNMDMEPMFHTIMQMILAGVIEDDFNSK